MSSEKAQDEKLGFDDAGRVVSVASGENVHVSEKGGKFVILGRYTNPFDLDIIFWGVSLIFIIADSAAILASRGFGITIDPAEADRVRKKIDRSDSTSESMLS